MMKAIYINVFWNDSYRECSNGGITERYDKLLLVSDNGYVLVDEKNPPEKLVKMVTERIGGKEHKHIEPVARPKRGYIGWTNGGSMAYSSDRRFPSEYPLCVHDRQDKYELYKG